MPIHGRSNSKRALLSALAIAAFCTAGQARSANHWDPELSLSGFASVRLARTGDVGARFDGGQSRLRYGAQSSGDRDRIFALPEAALEITAQANDWLSALVHLHHQPEDKNAVDVVRGFIEVTPPPVGPLRTSLKLGAFFPGISRENRGIAWSNTYTLTNSPGMTWIGEEVRPVGAALSARYLAKGYSVSGEAALFWANDTAGASLAQGGWSLTDLKTPLNGRIRHFNPQAPGVPTSAAPFSEIDNRPGFYLRGDVTVNKVGALSAIYYDNRADTSLQPQIDTLWSIHFASLTAEAQLPGDVTVLPQIMFGETHNRTFGVDFLTASLLFTRSFGRIDAAIRLDHFRNNDLLTGQPVSLEEKGQAVTVSFSTLIGDRHQLSLETIHVSAERAAAPPSGRRSETLVTLDYRISF